MKAFGHPIHPMLVVFPLGLLTTSLIFDVIGMATHNGTWHYVAEYLIGAGVVGGLVAGLFGLIDWTGIPKRTRARRIGAWHGGVNLIVLLIFFWSWFLRLASSSQPPANALILSFFGVGLALVGGWLGGELVEQLGVGVDPSANVNAPNSLSHETRPKHAA
jgi:uncharacterized membrane protein